MIEEESFDSLEALVQRWQEEQIAMQEFLGALADEDVTRPLRYTTESGLKRERPLWHALLHVVNHGTQHRSEAALLLTLAGHSPGDLDFTVSLSTLDTD